MRVAVGAVAKGLLEEIGRGSQPYQNSWRHDIGCRHPNCNGNQGELPAEVSLSILSAKKKSRPTLTRATKTVIPSVVSLRDSHWRCADRSGLLCPMGQEAGCQDCSGSRPSMLS